MTSHPFTVGVTELLCHLVADVEMTFDAASAVAPVSVVSIPVPSSTIPPRNPKDAPAANVAINVGAAPAAELGLVQNSPCVGPAVSAAFDAGQRAHPVVPLMESETDAMLPVDAPQTTP